MADPDEPSSEDENKEYKIHRRPDLQVVTSGARIHYSCDWISPSARPTVASDGYWGPRDGIRWYSYDEQPPKGWFRSWFDDRVKAGPLTPFWDRTWTEDPGQYTVWAEIRSLADGPHPKPTYCFVTQQIGQAGPMTQSWLDRLLQKGDAPSPDDVENQIARYRKLLDDAVRKHPPSDLKEHQDTVDKWADLASRLRGLLAPSDDKKRIPVRGLHLEAATQAQRPLLLFLTDLGPATRMAGRSGPVTEQRWSLVDWTDPTNPRFRGNYDGQGPDTRSAIISCFSNWNMSNRYPEGHVSYEIPPELRAILGNPARRDMDTSGKNLTDRVIDVFEWIAVGAMLVSGFCFIFVAIPALASAAFATSVVASTAGAVFSVGQRWRDGIFDWQADAVDGLTIVSNLIGTGIWARGARLKVLGKGGQTIELVFLGARVTTDAVQGVLIAASRIDEIDRLINDPNGPPDETARRLLALFAELAALGMMTAISFKAAAKESDNLKTKPKHLGSDPRANVPDDKLKDLVDASKEIDATKPPIAEGHTDDVQHKTTVNTGVHPAPPVAPEETSFARAYPDDKLRWRDREIEQYRIHLLDYDGFGVTAEVNDKTGDLTMVIETAKGSKKDGTLQRSKNLRADEVYPRMYKHFAEQGVEVKSVSGDLMWANVNETSIPLYDQLINDAMAANPKMSGPELEQVKADAAVAAVKVAKTYHYHAEAGFGRVTVAKRVGQVFEFKLER